MPFLEREILMLRPPVCTKVKSKLGNVSQITHLDHHLGHILKMLSAKFDGKARTSFLEIVIPEIAVFRQLSQHLITAIEAFSKPAAANLWRFFVSAGSSFSHVIASMWIWHKFRRACGDRRLPKPGAY